MSRVKSLWFLVAAVFFARLAGSVFASATNGTIDPVSRYAWTENAGWLDFGTATGDVHVTDSALSGYAWGENIGWVSLNCSNDDSCETVDYGVQNDDEGNISGYAWTENAGWINFDPVGGGVTIDTNGEFAGYAWGENIGWIVFNCDTTDSCADVDYKVATDWRPQDDENNSNEDDTPGPQITPATNTPAPGQYSAFMAQKLGLSWALPKTTLMKDSLNPERIRIIQQQITKIIAQILELQRQLAILLKSQR